MPINAQALSQECYNSFFGMTQSQLNAIDEMYGLIESGEFESVDEMFSCLNSIKSRFVLGKGFYTHSAIQEDIWYVDPSNPQPFSDQEMWLFYGAYEGGIMPCDIENDYAVLYSSTEAAIGPY